MVRLRARYALGVSPDQPEFREIRDRDVFVFSDSEHIAVGFGADRPWQEKWREVLDLKGDLDRAYVGELRGLSDVGYKRLVNGFCDATLELRDWLRSDERVSDGIRDVVGRYISETPALQACADVSNTDKHRKRDREKDAALRVHGFHKDERGQVKIQLHYEGPHAGRRAYDAQELADAAVDAWRAFLKEHGLAR